MAKYTGHGHECKDMMEPTVVYTAAEKAHCYVDANQPIANVMSGQDEWGDPPNESHKRWCALIYA